MKLKVCGLNNPFNIKELSDIGIDLFGFIFYKRSPRYYNNALDADVIRSLRSKFQTVGVFVNATEFEIMNSIADYHLSHIQLHGVEQPELCEKLKPYVQVIKTFSIDQKVNNEIMKPYQGICDYFLFDTKTRAHGGSGRKFNWRILDEYKLDTPFFLSGGIGLEDAAAIRDLDHDQLFGVDINSRFEVIPGTKDKKQVKEFIKQIKH